MALKASHAAPDGVWWVGKDGNVYAKGNLTDGVENLGSYAKGAYLMAGGYNQIDDPVNPPIRKLLGEDNRYTQNPYSSVSNPYDSAALAYYDD